jgi:signal peptidase II
MRRHLGLWLALAGLVVVLDQASKAWIMAVFGLGESLTVTPYFNVVFVLNPGASFNFLADAGGWQRWFFIVLALAICAWLLTMLRHHATERLLPAATVLILGGALGNVTDRIRFGAVVDFIQVHAAGWYFPAFNVADSAITLGVVLMLWHQVVFQEARDV